MKNILTIVVCFGLLFGCDKDDLPEEKTLNEPAAEPPAQALLTFPLKNSECTTGKNSSDNTTTMVEFKWKVSEYTESYTLSVTDLKTNDIKTFTTDKTSSNLSLKKGNPYSWYIISKNTKVTETATSEIWQFYNAGNTTINYTPFPAQIVFPESGKAVVKDTNNKIELNWKGADIDNDIESYKVYFSVTAEPLEKIVSSQLGTANTKYKVSVESATSYHWKVVTIDKEGNTSDSGIFVFKVI